MKYNKCYGKYRAIITKVEEEDNRATRVKVKCPKVYGDGESTWCYPCIPFILIPQVFIEMIGSVDTHDHERMGALLPPKVGDPVWIEFEEGDLGKPIWCGTWKEV